MMPTEHNIFTVPPLMKALNFLRFELFLLTHSNASGLAILFVLGWIAHSDGDTEFEEARAIYNIGLDAKHPRKDIKTLLQLVEHRNIKSLQLALEVIRNRLSPTDSKLFLELAIGIAIADGALMPSESYILQFIADLFNVNKKELERMFSNITGKHMHAPDDYSSATFWNIHFKEAPRYKNHKKQHQGEQKQQWQSSQSHPQTKIERAYKILGLTQSATEKDVKDAYRKLAMQNHPDRFASLGAEAVSAATIRFQKIKEAYEHIEKNA